MKFDESKIKFDWDAGHCYSYYTDEVPEDKQDEMYDFMYESETECDRVCVPLILCDWGFEVVPCECGCTEQYLDDGVDEYLNQVLAFANVVKEYGTPQNAKWYKIDKIPTFVGLARAGLLPSVPTDYKR
jgi:hypothetical protein